MLITAQESLNTDGPETKSRHVSLISPSDLVNGSLLSNYDEVYSPNPPPAFPSWWNPVMRPSGIFLLPASSGGLACNVLARLQIGRQLFRCVEHPPLNRPNRDRLGSGNLVVFPLLDKAQAHDFPLA